MNIDNLVPATLGGLDGQSQLAGVEAALKELIKAAQGCTDLQLELVKRQAAKHLKDLKLGDKQLVEQAFSSAAASTAGECSHFPRVEPWPHAVKLADVLDGMSKKIREHVVLTQEQADVVALWIAYTYVFNAFDVSPFLAITSATKRCGKTTLFNIVERLVHRPLLSSNVTPAVVFRSIEKWHPTLMIDEADTFLSMQDELRGILNSGHTRSGAFTLRCVGENFEATRFSTWAPKAYAAIGKMPTTIEDRSIVVHLQRKVATDASAPLVTGVFERTFGLPVRQQLTRWARDTKVSGELTPQPPRELNDRAADNWRPLLAIAEDAGSGWVDRANRAALATRIDEDEDEVTMLLQDVSEIFSKVGEYVSSELLVEKLTELDHRPWGDYKYGRPISKNQLARLLRPVGVRPGQCRFGAETVRGYSRSSFTEAFAIYLRQEPVQPEQPGQVPEAAAALNEGDESE